MIRSFDTLLISTQTIVVKTNMQVNKQDLFELLPVATISLPPQTSLLEFQNKKKEEQERYILSLGLDKQIITLEYQQQVRGYKIIKKKSSALKSKRQKYFSNNLTVVMCIGNKLINFKYPRSGSIQMTGLKSEEQSIQCIQQFYKYLIECSEKTDKKLFEMEEKDQDLELIFNVVMTNVNFELGFHINRENLDRYLNQDEYFHSLLEPIMSYTGVNIKKKFNIVNFPLNVLCYSFEKKEWRFETMMYDDYIHLLPKQKKTKEKSKVRKNTFLVFYNGKVIFTGMKREFMKDDYYYFIEMLNQGKKEIEENNKN